MDILLAMVLLKRCTLNKFDALCVCFFPHLRNIGPLMAATFWGWSNWKVVAGILDFHPKR